MASALRSTLVRQACALAPAVRTASTPALRSGALLSTAFQKPSFVNGIVPGSMPVAAFHATSRKELLPPLPQRIEGTANEAARLPTPSPSHGSYHWTFERGVSVALIPVTMAPFIGGVPYPVVDAALCALLVVHSHIGFQSVITDYLPRKRLRTIRPMFDYGVYVASAVVALGLYEYETNDVGLTETVKRIWKA